jgi:hypothetical protein
VPHDQLRNAIEAIRLRLQAELEAQIRVLDQHQQEAIDIARRAADVEAHEHWAVKLEQIRAEWASRLETELAAAAADADRRTVAECTRARLETEQVAAESIAQLRQETAADLERARASVEQLKADVERATVEAEKTLADQRQRFEAGLARSESLEREISQLRNESESERRGLNLTIEGQRNQIASLTKELEKTRDSSVTEARAVERHSRLATIERLLDSVRAISSAHSLSDVLSTLVAGAAGEVPRVALFIIEGKQLQSFRVSGFDETVDSIALPVHECSALLQAVESGEAISVTAPNAPRFAALPPDRAGLGVPVTVGGQTVALLYADDVSAGEPDAPASWPEAIQILSQHTSETLARLTAVRSAQAIRFRGGSVARAASSAAPASSEDDQAARRYARLLVSEIKLYNEAAVRVGREKRDLLSRLGPEVDRARRLYEERVSQAVVARSIYFQQELVQTLADGDPSLLGKSAVPS